MPKRPYRLKLAAKRALLGMPSSKHWVLLADYADASLLRNELAFKLGQSTALAWTPRQRAVEVLLNGELLGVYHLTEQIRTDPARVALTPRRKAPRPPAAVTCSSATRPLPRSRRSTAARAAVARRGSGLPTDRSARSAPPQS